MADAKGYGRIVRVQNPAISKHLRNIFAEGELDESVVVSKMEITTSHGAMPDRTQTKETQFYNLDAIISVGYRVNSSRATQFRIWATGVLKEYMEERTGRAYSEIGCHRCEKLFERDAD